MHTTSMLKMVMDCCYPVAYRDVSVLEGAPIDRPNKWETTSQNSKQLPSHG